jgi:hypothetical protein
MKKWVSTQAQQSLQRRPTAQQRMQALTATAAVDATRGCTHGSTLHAMRQQSCCAGVADVLPPAVGGDCSTRTSMHTAVAAVHAGHADLQVQPGTA